MNKYLKMIGFYLVILLIIIVAVTFLNPMQSDVKTLTYSELLSNLDQKQVSEIEINQSSVKGKLANGDSFEAIVPQYLIDEQIFDSFSGYYYPDGCFLDDVCKPVWRRRRKGYVLR